MASDGRLPTTLITGFLGSGKTTLLNGLLAHDAMRDTAVIVNEFGEVGLDHLLIETAFEDAVLLRSGCICCTVRGDLVDTLLSLWDRRRRGEIPPFARIAIETTGLADPAPILQILTSEPGLQAHYVFDRVIVTVDAVNAAAQLAGNYEAVKQAALADVLVLTKTDLAAAEQAAEVRRRLAALNPVARVLTVIGGRAEPEALFGPLESSGVLAERLLAAARLGGAHEPEAAEGEAEHLLRHHGIASLAITEAKPLPWPAFQSWLKALAALKGPDLLRVKGLINIAGRKGPVLVQGVQHVFHPPVELARWPDEDRRTRIVFITRNIPAEALRRSFAAVLARG